MPRAHPTATMLSSPQIRRWKSCPESPANRLTMTTDGVWMMSQIAPAGLCEARS